MKRATLFLTSLILCQMCFAVTITATDNHNGTCLIELNTETGEENIVAMALEVDCLAGEIVAVDITSYNPLMNIYPDAAYTEELSGDGYQYGEGTPITSDNAPGEIGLPSDDFTICAGMLNVPGVDGYANVRFLLSANENVIGTIQENAMRGGIIAIVGSELDISPAQLNFTITIPEPATVMLLALGGLALRRRKQ